MGMFSYRVISIQIDIRMLQVNVGASLKTISFYARGHGGTLLHRQIEI